MDPVPGDLGPPQYLCGSSGMGRPLECSIKNEATDLGWVGGKGCLRSNSNEEEQVFLLCLLYSRPRAKHLIYECVRVMPSLPNPDKNLVFAC